jgi:hypothetical protein
MNYATDNHIGNSATARAKKTKTASRTARRVYAWMQRPKDAGEVQKDKPRSVPAGMLPMVF